MGLDTSHDAWHGPYSSFHSWRLALARAAGLSIYHKPWSMGTTLPTWVMPSEDDILYVLMSHSDCDGTINSADCAPLADRLEALIPHIGAPDDWWDPNYHINSTHQFIKGLRLAASLGEDIDFH